MEASDPNGKEYFDTFAGMADLESRLPDGISSFFSSTLILLNQQKSNSARLPACLSHFSGFIYAVLFFFTATITLAQQSSVYVTRGAESFSMMYFKPFNKTVQHRLNPYLYPDFREGYLLFADGRNMEGQLRLDLHRNEMEAVVASDSLLVTQPLLLEEAVMGNQLFIFSTWVSGNKGQPTAGIGFFEVLTKRGQFSILLQRTLRVNKSRPSQANVQLGLPYEEKVSFAIVEKLFYQTDPHEEAKPLKKGHRNILKILPSSEHERLKTYIKSKKLKLRRTKDIVDLINFYNS